MQYLLYSLDSEVNVKDNSKMAVPTDTTVIVGIIREAERRSRNWRGGARWVTSHSVAEAAGVTPPTARDWLSRWEAAGLLVSKEVAHRSNVTKTLYMPSDALWREYFAGTNLEDAYPFVLSFTQATTLAVFWSNH